VQLDQTDGAQKEEELLLLDFYADWCKPCQMMKSVLEEYEMRAPEVRISKVNVDEHNDFVSELQITALPTLILMRGGVQVHRIEGFRSLENLVLELSPFIISKGETPKLIL